MASLYLIRHGQASFGSDNYDQLSPLGQRQADVSGQFFVDVGLHFAEAVSGDLSRQRETGERVLTSQPALPAPYASPCRCEGSSKTVFRPGSACAIAAPFARR